MKVKDQETNTTPDLSDEHTDSRNSNNNNNGEISVKANPPTRNVSTAPVFSRPRGLEAVLEEEDEGSVTDRSPLPPDTDGRVSLSDTDMGGEREDDDGGGEGESDGEEERGDEADDEAVDNKDGRKKRKSKCRHGAENGKSSPSKSDGKTVSRASTRKSRASRQQSATSNRGVGGGVDGQSSESESEAEDALRQRDSRSDLLDIPGVDITNDKDWDTDIEIEEAVSVYDHSGKTMYVEACRKFNVVPASYFLRHMGDPSLSMRHHGLAGDGMRAVAASLVSNATINSLDISDNWLGQEGGTAVCQMLKENCFITDLNLSDNRLNVCAEELCQVIEQNDTLRKVNLSGNQLDDQCAEYLTELIMNTHKLESLNLSHNNLGEKAGVLLGPAISENLCLKELDLSWNHLRRKGAMAVAAGIKTNVFMKKVNLSWNGFGLEGSLALADALKTNNVLEEMDIMNNRITTEGAVLIGKGLSLNETLKVFKIGKNPMQSAGCWAIAAAILKNPNSVLEKVDFTDVMVNKDFVALWKQVEEAFPSLKIVHGGTEPPLKPKKRIHPMVKVTSYINSNNIRLVDFFNQFDKDGSMNVTREEFRQGIMETGLNLTDEEVEILVNELDADGDGAINYSELAIGHSDFEEREKKISTQLRPMTS